MRKSRSSTTFLLIAVAALLTGAGTASAQPYYALEYWGGPVLNPSPFTRFITALGPRPRSMRSRHTFRLSRLISRARMLPRASSP